MSTLIYAWIKWGKKCGGKKLGMVVESLEYLSLHRMCKPIFSPCFVFYGLKKRYKRSQDRSTFFIRSIKNSNGTSKNVVWWGISSFFCVAGQLLDISMYEWCWWRWIYRTFDTCLGNVQCIFRWSNRCYTHKLVRSLEIERRSLNEFRF